MPSSRDQTPTTSTLIPSHDLVHTMSLGEVLRALALDHAATLLDTATQKAITRNDSPTALVDHLMREQLRVTIERRAQRALKRAAIFPLTTLDTFDFDYPKSIDRDLVMRAATLDFVRDKANCVFVGPSGVGKTHTSPMPSPNSPASGATACASSPLQTWSMTSSLPRLATVFTAASPPGAHPTCSWSTSWAT